MKSKKDNHNLKHPKVAIIVCINDLITHRKNIHTNDVKSINFIEQFVMLYYSIKENWHFNYEIYMFHSYPIREKYLNKLKTLDINIVQINEEEYFIRPHSFCIPINCDFRLVLDTDMIAVNDPNFDFKYEAYGMYSTMDYEKLYMNKKIYQTLGLTVPQNYKYIPPADSDNIYGNVNIIESFYSQGTVNEVPSERYFPTFNCGAILIANKHSMTLGKKLLEYRKIYKAPNSQDVIGIVINHITNGNWMHFNKGFNYYINDKHESVTKIMKEYTNNGGKIYLLHYLRLQFDNPYYIKYVKKYHDMCKNLLNS